jgi:hypothetical protein
MAALHTMFGLGSFIAPLAARAAMEGSDQWSIVFLGAIPFLICISLYLMFGVRGDHDMAVRTLEASDLQSKNLSLDMQIVGVQIFYVLGEVLTSMWMTSYLIDQGLPISEATVYLAAFFLMITLLRATCSLFVKTAWIIPILISSLLLALVAGFIGRMGFYWGLAAVGLLGPFFPLYMAQISLWFPSKQTKLTVWIVSGMQIMLGLLNLIVGQTAVALGLSVAYWIPMVMLVCCLLLLLRVRAQVR